MNLIEYDWGKHEYTWVNDCGTKMDCTECSEVTILVDAVNELAEEVKELRDKVNAGVAGKDGG